MTPPLSTPHSEQRPPAKDRVNDGSHGVEGGQRTTAWPAPRAVRPS